MSKLSDCVTMFGYVLRAMLCFAAAGLLLYAIIGFVQCRGFAAPAPPPSPITQEQMVGEWDWQWSPWSTGWIVFQADGFYYSRHSPGCTPTYCGGWWVKDGVLTLHEGIYHDWARDDYAASERNAFYRLPLKPGFGPVVRGEYAGQPVILTRRR